VILEAIDSKTTALNIAALFAWLWTGGSRACSLASYVKQHFADPEVMKPTPEHAKLDAYYKPLITHPAEFAVSTCREMKWSPRSSLPGWFRSTTSA